MGSVVLRSGWGWVGRRAGGAGRAEGEVTPNYQTHKQAWQHLPHRLALTLRLHSRMLLRHFLSLRETYCPHPHGLAPGQRARRQLLLHRLDGIAPPQPRRLPRCSSGEGQVAWGLRLEPSCIWLFIQALGSLACSWNKHAQLPRPPLSCNYHSKHYSKASCAHLQGAGGGGTPHRAGGRRRTTPPPAAGGRTGTGGLQDSTWAVGIRRELGRKSQKIRSFRAIYSKFEVK